MSRLLVGPFNRVEGDLEVSLEIYDNRVRSARVNSPLYRGFEQILLGKTPLDALVYTPRICGICSVSQSVACAWALADAMQLTPPPNGERCTALVLANENLADLLTHFYLFFMPDFARERYSGEDWYAPVARRFKAVQGDAAREVLPARAEFLHLMGLLAGKWPHSLSIQPGGSAKPVEPQERLRLLAILAGFRRFLERTLFGAELEQIAELDSEAALRDWAAQGYWQSNDLRTLLYLSDRLELDRLGRASDRFMSYGSYQIDGERWLPAGVRSRGGAVEALDTEKIREDLSHSWLDGGHLPRHPRDGLTAPSLENPDGYSWCKAPRLDGAVVETGALARQFINGHPLIVDLVDHSGGNVRNRLIARLLELALVVPQMERWVKQLESGEPFCHHGRLPDEAEGAGLVEAARGSLGHWLSIRDGRIANYQVIAPTTWNFSPRDGLQVPGPLEQALAGAPVIEGEREPVAVQHIVRSFDPCMVCSVH
ncbi:nickel-dependent hydrogenase large subunit [Marinobacterium arenosum]|uniref:nickel-dependent hydrogenase large subunit n=1 Tax=Marinobacterium arenosum TaxID=2862496 RepID=UPI001C941D1B|nr:nickel-dependent hydrogenase large subunit [Marinobacterium arenosum]MBY4677927.1 nickel-dependent hydrogenase large subunit [Marinobacterium arenosum]